MKKASAKIRNEGPLGDDEMKEEVLSGQIPLATKTLQPIHDNMFGVALEFSESVKTYYAKNK